MMKILRIMIWKCQNTSASYEDFRNSPYYGYITDILKVNTFIRLITILTAAAFYYSFSKLSGSSFIPTIPF